MTLHGVLRGALAAAIVAAPAVHAQAPDPGSTFRVFLATGQALMSYGESAIVGDRVVFTLMIGDGSAATRYQVVSLAAAAVDLKRTTDYGYAMRAARYAATRGETDYADMTAEVSRALEELSKVADPKRRLAMAEEARRRLLGWTRDNYGYRAKDVQELARLFEEVIAELRAAAGESSFAFDLVAGPPMVPAEPLQPIPTFREAIAQALAAAAVADVSTDRAAILKAAAETASLLPETDTLREDIKRRMAEEDRIDEAYVSLAASVLEQAEAAVQRGDARAVERLKDEVAARDKALGERRPGDVEALNLEIDARLERARARADLLVRYAALRPSLLQYENGVRSVFNTLDGATPSLIAMRDMVGPGIVWLDKVDVNLKRAQAVLTGVAPPDVLSDIHSSLGSALYMALEACRRRRVAMATGDAIVAREASAAAAGAMMLAEHARKDMLARLHAPK